MRTVTRAALGIVVGLATVGLAVGCGKAGESGSKSGTEAKNVGCEPVAGKPLKVLADDKNLQVVENLVPAINSKAADPALVAALDKVSAVLGSTELVSLNKATDVDRKTPKVAAEDFA